MSHLFTEEKYNALYQALEEVKKEINANIRAAKANGLRSQCAVNQEYYSGLLKGFLNSKEILVDKLKELGYIIVKKS